MVCLTRIFGSDLPILISTAIIEFDVFLNKKPWLGVQFGFHRVPEYTFIFTLRIVKIDLVR